MPRTKEEDEEEGGPRIRVSPFPPSLRLIHAPNFSRRRDVRAREFIRVRSVCKFLVDFNWKTLVLLRKHSRFN